MVEFLQPPSWGSSHHGRSWIDTGTYFILRKIPNIFFSHFYTCWIIRCFCFNNSYRIEHFVLGILLPGTFHPCIFPKECSPPMFRFVVRFSRVRIEDCSRNRFASTVYFAQSQTTLFPSILFMGGMFRGGNNRDGIFRGEIFRSPKKSWA